MSRYDTQEVCPWNGPKLVQVTASLVELLRTALDPEAWDAFSRGSAIRRAGRAGLARNVCVAMGNWLASVEEPPESAVAVLREAAGDPDPLVREHAAWALGQLE